LENKAFVYRGKKKSSFLSFPIGEEIKGKIKKNKKIKRCTPLINLDNLYTIALALPSQCKVEFNEGFQ
jgi:hypothetical protein